jgi:hypothetical protein
MDSAISLMHFFTAAWRDGDLSDEDYEDASIAYDRHLQLIRDSFPPRLLQLLEAVPLHDAKVRFARVQRDGTFKLGLRAGDQQCGYFDVDLDYRGVETIDGLPSAAAVLSRADGEIIRDEIDVASPSACFEHRFLFAPEGELLLRFHDFDFVATTVDGREFKRDEPPFVDFLDLA